MACVAGSGEEGVSGCDRDRVGVGVVDSDVDGRDGVADFLGRWCGDGAGHQRSDLSRYEAASRSGEAFCGRDWCPEVEGSKKGLGAASDVVDAELEVQVRST